MVALHPQKINHIQKMLDNHFLVMVYFSAYFSSAVDVAAVEAIVEADVPNVLEHCVYLLTEYRHVRITWAIQYQSH